MPSGRARPRWSLDPEAPDSDQRNPPEDDLAGLEPASLNGVVAGAGSALAIASDLRIAVPDAKIPFLFAKVGRSGADMDACLLLPRLVGLGRASELLLMGDSLPADEALMIGLCNRMVSTERLGDVSRERAQGLAEGPEHALGVTKQTLDRQLSMTLPQALAWDARVQAECMAHPDFREAYEAFKAKRPPRFGRVANSHGP